MEMTLLCEDLLLDMTKEKEVLIMTWSLFVIKQQRRIVASLWQRAQGQKRGDISEKLTRIGQKLHQLEYALRSTLTADSAYN